MGFLVLVKLGRGLSLFRQDRRAALATSGQCCDLVPDGEQFAYSQGHDIYLAKVGRNAIAQADDDSRSLYGTSVFTRCKAPTLYCE